MNRALLAAVLALLVAALVQTYRLKSMQTELAQTRLAYSEAYVTALKAARTETEKLEERKNEAINSAQARNADLAADADAARAAVVSLRRELATARAGLSELSRAADARYTAALADVLTSCADEYQRVAERADGHASDVRLMIEAWPR